MSSRLIPAGVPRNLQNLKARIAAKLENTPVFFFAVVIGIALVFKVAIGWAKTATDQPVADPVAETATPTAKAHASRSTSPTSNAVGRDDDSVNATGATGAGAGPTVMPADTISGDPKLGGGLPKRKPRTHGRR